MRREENYGMGEMHPRLFSAMFYALLFLAIAGLCGCGGGGGDAVPASPVNSVSKVLESIRIEPLTATTVAGTPKTFTAYGHYSDGTDSDLSDQVDWSSTADGDAITIIIVNGVTTVSGNSVITITAKLGDIISDPNATLTVSTPPD